MAAKPIDIFPDLHHKMSKKIAQLTKVIYHLNTKNEDHQSELDNLNANNQMEIQHILRDAATKISKFKDMVESKQSAANVEIQIEKLTKKHEIEKQNALKELESYKLKVKEREQKVAAEFQSKFESTQDKVEKMNAKFRERIEAFDKLSQQYQTDILNARTSGSASLEEIRKKYEAEMSDYVKNSNEKYNNMLVEQLRNQENLKSDLELKMTKTQRELENKFKEDMEKQLGQLRAFLNGEKQEQLLNMKREYEEKIIKLKEDSSNQLENALNEIKKRSEEINNLRKEKDQVIMDLQTKITQLNNQITNLSQDSSKQNQEMITTISNLQNELKQLNDQIIQLKKDLDMRQGLLDAKQDEYDSLSGQMTCLEVEIQRLNNLLSNNSNLKDSLEAELNKKLNAAQAELVTTKQKVNDITNTLKVTQTDLDNQKKETIVLKTKYEKEIEELRVENKKLLSQLKDSSNSSNQLLEKAKEEINILKQNILQKENDFIKEKQEIENINQKNRNSLTDLHRTEVLQLQNAEKSLKESHLQQESIWNDTILKMKKEFEIQLSNAEHAHTTKLEEMVKVHDEIVNKLKAQLKLLETQLTDTTANSDIEKTNLKNDYNKLNTKYSAMQLDLEKRKKDNEKNESIQNSLKNQIEQLREELKQVCTYMCII